LRIKPKSLDMQRIMIDISEKGSIIVLLYEVNLSVLYALISYF
jgi:hypothetical protein